MSYYIKSYYIINKLKKIKDIFKLIFILKLENKKIVKNLLNIFNIKKKKFFFIF